MRTGPGARVLAIISQSLRTHLLRAYVPRKIRCRPELAGNTPSCLLQGVDSAGQVLDWVLDYVLDWVLDEV